MLIDSSSRPLIFFPTYMAHPPCLSTITDLERKGRRACRGEENQNTIGKQQGTGAGKKEKS
jgi:hypothetical protein